MLKSGLSIVLIWCALLVLALTAEEVTIVIDAPATAVDPGITHREIQIDTPRQVGINCVITTVTNPVGFLHVFTPGNSCDKRVQTSTQAKDRGCAYAINGGPFNMDNGQCEGSIISNGTVQQIAADGSGYSNFGLTADGKYVFGAINSTEVSEYKIKELISGFVQGLLVDNGAAVVSTDAKIAQRQAVGIDKDGALLFLTVDGAEDDVHGMNMTELSSAFVDVGAVYAVNLDGGGSTTTWEKNSKSLKKGHFVNRPTCADVRALECERRVASILCIM